MKIKYDPTSDVMYFEFSDTTVTTKRATPDIAIDYDVDGRVAGVEVLDAKKNVLSRAKEFSIQIDRTLQAFS